VIFWPCAKTIATSDNAVKVRILPCLSRFSGSPESNSARSTTGGEPGEAGPGPSGWGRSQGADTDESTATNVMYSLTVVARTPAPTSAAQMRFQYPEAFGSSDSSAPIPASIGITPRTPRLVTRVFTPSPQDSPLGRHWQGNSEGVLVSCVHFRRCGAVSKSRKFKYASRFEVYASCCRGDQVRRIYDGRVVDCAYVLNELSVAAFRFGVGSRPSHLNRGGEGRRDPVSWS